MSHHHDITSPCHVCLHLALTLSGIIDERLRKNFCGLALQPAAVHHDLIIEVKLINVNLFLDMRQTMLTE